ncbi:biotin/lipoyl-containing protein [Sedimentibacter sp.]|uniref:biotin/lipoyl-containing protein n=1 Tax=Sedimentibacter sp. TaxID=1960295 RepID=UPI0028B1E591|nr:biotin/lipoyl-containing protein [Sedimentibacter sp.]
MKRYLITVKGISYEVEVEELKGQRDANVAERVVQPEPVITKPIEEKKTPVSAPAPVSDSAKSITCPMPGTIFKIMVKPGDAIKKGDVVLILEAMKMENEIFASADEVVDSVRVTEGATVNTGDVLVTFK